MFSVPGWAVSASSLVKEAPKSKKSNADAVTSHTSKKSKKRKRHDESAAGERLSRGGSEDQKPYSVAGDERANKNQEVVDGFEEDGVFPRSSSRDAEIGRTSGPKRADGKQHNLEQRPKNLPQAVSRSISKKPDSTSPLATANLTPLQAKMRSKLTSARFRHLNETLYTASSSEALQIFNESPELFAEYHAGFAQQVRASWPQNPVDDYIRTIKMRGALSEPSQTHIPLPRRKTGSCTVVDLGCGDAPLARGCQAVIKTMRLKFHNYDLHTPNSLVVKADISDLPLRDGEADIAIFCLSLMGTNWVTFVEEAWRVLRGDGKGEVWVAEVKSRFGRVIKGRVVENSVGKRRKKPQLRRAEDEYDGPEQFVQDENTEDEDETDTSGFIKVFTRRGFQLRENSVNRRNKMFVSMTFIKSGIPTAGKYKGLKWNGKKYQKQQDGKMKFASAQKNEEITPAEEAKVLKPCVYKSR